MAQETVSRAKLPTSERAELLVYYMMRHFGLHRRCKVVIPNHESIYITVPKIDRYGFTHDKVHSVVRIFQMKAKGQFSVSIPRLRVSGIETVNWLLVESNMGMLEAVTLGCTLAMHELMDQLYATTSKLLDSDPTVLRGRMEAAKMATSD